MGNWGPPQKVDLQGEDVLAIVGNVGRGGGVGFPCQVVAEGCWRSAEGLAERGDGEAASAPWPTFVSGWLGPMEKQTIHRETRAAL